MRTFILFFALVFPSFLFSQQVADTSYNPAIPRPEYPFGKGPVIFIDEGHYNFHTKNGRYSTFARLLERDGYVVKEYQGQFERNELNKGKILVISNALNKVNEENWYLPTPSAFTKTEIETVRNWVNSGGSLFLIADHMPMAGAAKELAAEFGFEFSNGFVFDSLMLKEGRGNPAVFSINEKTLFESAVTNGRDPSEKVSKVTTFTGQGFKIPQNAIPVLIFSDQYVDLLPDTAWVFSDKIPSFNVKGWSQGAYKRSGKGRVAVFGEAAMFTAQLAGPEKRRVGMNSEDAPENFQLLLNIIHWLDGKMD